MKNKKLDIVGILCGLFLIAVLAANANSDRKVNLRDAQFIKAVVAGDEEIAW